MSNNQHETIEHDSERAPQSQESALSGEQIDAPSSIALKQQSPPSLQKFCISKGSAFNTIDDHKLLQRESKQLPSNREHEPLIKSMTVNISILYTKCSGSQLQFCLPRKKLTKPSETRPEFNNGKDNEEGNLIISTNDMLNGRFVVKDVLGQGTFGQVVRCEDLQNIGDHVAVKVIKNKKAYLRQAKIEIRILETLQRYEPEKHHIVRMFSHFYHENHLCIVFERLNSNLFELIKSNKYNGLSTNVVRVFAAHILDALTVLSQARIIHCDLKPENILLTDQSPHIKVIDFGSACMENETVYSYIQSRFYRSPEVLFGCEYDMSIDMWSFGCICAELFLGLPLFPGVSQYNQVFLIIEMLGYPPVHMIEMGKFSHKYFKKLDQPRQDLDSGRGDSLYVLKSEEEYCRENNCQPKPWKRYFNYSTLKEVIFYYMHKKNISASEREKEEESRRALIDFLQGALRWDPIERWTPTQALRHPFIKNRALQEPFIPETDPIKEQQRQYMSQRYRMFRHQQQGLSVGPVPPNGRKPGNPIPIQIISGYFDQPLSSPSMPSFSPHIHNPQPYGYGTPRQQAQSSPLGASPVFNANNVASKNSGGNISSSSSSSSYPIPIPHHHRHHHHYPGNGSMPRVPLGQSPYSTPAAAAAMAQSPYGQSPFSSGSYGIQQSGSSGSQLMLGASPSAASSFMQHAQRQRGATQQQPQMALSPRSRSMSSSQQASAQPSQQAIGQSGSHQQSAAIRIQPSPHAHYHYHHPSQQLSPQQHTPPQQHRRKQSNSKKHSSQQPVQQQQQPVNAASSIGSGGSSSASKPPKAPRNGKGGNNSGDMDSAFGSFDPDFSTEALIGEESGTPPSSSSYMWNPYYQQQPPYHGANPPFMNSPQHQGLHFGTPTQFDAIGMSPSTPSGFPHYGSSPASSNASFGNSANALLGSSYGSHGNSGQYHAQQQQSGSYGSQRGSYGSHGQQYGKKQ